MKFPNLQRTTPMVLFLSMLSGMALCLAAAPQKTLSSQALQGKPFFQKGDSIRKYSKKECNRRGEKSATLLAFSCLLVGTVGGIFILTHTDARGQELEALSEIEGSDKRERSQNQAQALEGRNTKREEQLNRKEEKIEDALKKYEKVDRSSLNHFLTKFDKKFKNFDFDGLKNLVEGEIKSSPKLENFNYYAKKGTKLKLPVGQKEGGKSVPMVLELGYSSNQGMNGGTRLAKLNKSGEEKEVIIKEVRINELRRQIWCSRLPVPVGPKIFYYFNTSKKDSSDYLILMEDLRSDDEKYALFEENQYEMLKGLLEGMAAMHKVGILHTDVNAQNVRGKTFIDFDETIQFSKDSGMSEEEKQREEVKELAAALLIKKYPDCYEGIALSGYNMSYLRQKIQEKPLTKVDKFLVEVLRKYCEKSEKSLNAREAYGLFLQRFSEKI